MPAGHCTRYRLTGTPFSYPFPSARIFDATLKQLAKLRYHKDTVQAIATLEERHVSADWREGAGDIGDDSDVDSDAESEGNARTGNADELLVTGGKEGRICLWQMP